MPAVFSSCIGSWSCTLSGTACFVSLPPTAEGHRPLTWKTHLPADPACIRIVELEKGDYTLLQSQSGSGLFRDFCTRVLRSQSVCLLQIRSDPDGELAAVNAVICVSWECKMSASTLSDQAGVWDSLRCGVESCSKTSACEGDSTQYRCTYRPRLASTLHCSGRNYTYSEVERCDRVLSLHGSVFLLMGQVLDLVELFIALRPRPRFESGFVFHACHTSFRRILDLSCYSQLRNCLLGRPF